MRRTWLIFSQAVTVAVALLFVVAKLKPEWLRSGASMAPPGLVTLYRYREAPHPRVTFQGDFSRRLEPQPGMKVLYARTTIASEKAEVKRLALGSSDEVSVFLDGKLLYRGRSAQSHARRGRGLSGELNPVRTLFSRLADTCTSTVSTSTSKPARCTRSTSGVMMAGSPGRYAWNQAVGPTARSFSSGSSDAPL